MSDGADAQRQPRYARTSASDAMEVTWTSRAGTSIPVWCEVRGEDEVNMKLPERKLLCHISDAEVSERGGGIQPIP